jgi:hypothetical protein
MKEKKRMQKEKEKIENERNSKVFICISIGDYMFFMTLTTNTSKWLHANTK